MPSAFICRKGAASVSDGQMAKVKDALPRLLVQEFSVKDSPSAQFGPKKVKIFSLPLDPLFSDADVPLVIIASVPEHPDTFTDFQKRENRVAEGVRKILEGKIDFYLEIQFSPWAGVMVKRVEGL